MKKGRIVIVFILFFLLSCTTKSLFDGRETLITKFPQTLNLKGQRLNIEILGVVDIDVIDTFLIAYTPLNSSFYCQVYSTNNYEYLGSFFPVGRGPAEFYAISYERCDEVTLDGIKTWYANSIQQYRWDITESILQRKTVVDSIIRKKEILSNGIWLPGSDSMMLGFQRTSNNIQYIQYNGKKFSENNIYPKKISKKILPLASMEPYIKPDKSKIAYIGWSINYLCVFNTDFSDFQALSIYEKPISLHRVLQIKEEERILFYSNNDVTNKYIYALYLNQPKKNRRYHTGNEEIHIFDWDANPIMNIIIPENIMFFTVDEKHKCLYGLTSDEKIYKYDLTEYLTAL